MGKLDHYTEADQGRIKAIACALIEGQIEKGKIACTDEAIRAAMPQAIADATGVVNAAYEFLAG